MSEILQQWLCTKLGIILDMQPSLFGIHMRDGILLAKLLHSYDIITVEQMQTILPSREPNVCYGNLLRIKQWMHYTGVDCSDSVMKEISEGKGSIAIRLLYQLFLSLESKDHIEFYISKTNPEKLRKSRFKVTVVEDPHPSPELAKKHHLTHKINEREDLEQFFDQKFRKLLDVCKAVRKRQKEKVLKEETEVTESINDEEEEHKVNASYGNRNNNNNDEMNEDKDVICDENYDDMVVEEKRQANELRCEELVNVNEARKRIKQMQQRSRNVYARQLFKLRMQRLLLTKLWGKVLKLQEKQFDDLITNKLLKQSQYEKQIANKLLHIRHEKRILVQNRLLMERLFSEQQELEAHNKLVRHNKDRDREKEAIELEKERAKELQRRICIYKSKKDLELKHGICKDIMESFADIAVKTSEYRRVFNEDAPPIVMDEWKAVFNKCQQIFEAIDDIADDNYLAGVGPLAEVELKRQEALNEHSLEDYLKLEGPWDVRDLNPNILSIELNDNILGYIVHRLLHLKYPLPEKPLPAELPEVAVSAVLLGITEERVINALSELLRKRGIRLICMETVINHYIETYRNELPPEEAVEIITQSLRTTHKDKKSRHLSKVNVKDASDETPENKDKKDIDDNQMKEQKDGTEDKKDKKGNKEKEDNGKKKAKKENEKSVGGRKRKKSTGEEIEAVTLEEKETQTPDVLPEVEDQPFYLSPKAEIGKNAYRIMSLGGEIPDNILTEMFIDHLREQENLQGWVLLNYPSTYNQASIFEEKFTGEKIPKVEQKGSHMELIVIEGTYMKGEETIIEEEKDSRDSSLLPDPMSKPEPDSFKTRLTAFVNAIRKDSASVLKAQELDFEICDENTSDLDFIYAQQGINYSFYYRSMDFPTLKRLAKILIGDMECPPKPSLELFGDIMDDVENLFPSDTGKKLKGLGTKTKLTTKPKGDEEQVDLPPAAVKERVATLTESSKSIPSVENGTEKDKKEKGSKKMKEKRESERKGKKSEVEFLKLGNQIEEKTQDEEQPVKEEIPKSNIGADEVEQPDVEIVPSKPGEEGWEYINTELPECMQIALATLWENVEEVYIKDFMEIFFLKRTHSNTLVPYTNFVKNSLREFIARPDSKQQTVLDFQKRYNDIEEDLREDIEMKNELHCRVAEFQNVLWNICDERKAASENERRNIIKEHWLTSEMISLTNIFVSALQLEIDRSVDTLQLLYDYYVSMLGRLPITSYHDKYVLTKLEIELEGNESSDTIETRRGKVNSKSGKVDSRSGSRFPSIKNIMAKILINPLTSENITTPFHIFITESTRLATNFIEELHTFFKDTIDNEKVVQPVSKAVVKPKKKTKKKSIAPVVPEDDVNAKLYQEWNTALQMEINRVLFRLQLIQSRAMADLTATLNYVQKTFYMLYNEIGARYEREVFSVEKLSRVLCNAIEEEVRIQPELVLEDDRFFVRSDVFMFPDPPPEVPPPLEERILFFEFRIRQLEQLMQKLMRLAPNGLIPERAFVFMLQDLIAVNADEGDGKILPKIWNDIKPGELEFIMQNIYGKVEYLDWRDFLILALDFEYPTNIELLEARENFLQFDVDKKEIISWEDYIEIKLWFEKDWYNDLQHKLRIDMAKEFLYHLFEIEDKGCNYTALLLAFCKAINPNVGFANALTISAGKIVKLVDQDAALKAEVEGIATNILDQVLEDTIQTAEGFILHELMGENDGEEMKPKVGTGHMSAVVQLLNIHKKRMSSLEEKGEEDSPQHLSRIGSPPAPPPPTPVSRVTSNKVSNIETSLKRGPKQFDEVEMVTFEQVFSVLSTCLPWHAKVPPFVMGGLSSLHESLEDLFDELKLEDGTVRIGDLVEHPFIKELLSVIHKFKYQSLPELIFSIVQHEVEETDEKSFMEPQQQNLATE